MKSLLTSLILLLMFMPGVNSQTSIPLPEHPRPDFQREQWVNLNGYWDFKFDKTNIGETEKWFNSPVFDKKILVPFPWGSKLSEVANEADIAWYSRSIEVPSAWDGKRVFLVVGASDWITSVWVNGALAGKFQGGYTPFEFDLTQFVKPGQKAQLVLRVDDTPHDFKLEGKQGYGQAKGIWQTPYLEARGSIALEFVHFTPDIDKQKVTVNASLSSVPGKDVTVQVKFKNGGISQPVFAPKFAKESREITFDIPIPNQHLWNLEDPYLYETEVIITQNNKEEDRVSTYFGMRKISVMNLPGLNFPYVALNNKPVYLQLTLDQSYNPDGFYTFPSDDFMREEIIRSKKIGLNGNRIHIKVEVPRKLYWADKLGLLIMADVPNFWGEPSETARKEWETAMRGMLKRDFNHPAIFSWVLFNETWGLFSKNEKNQRRYVPETQAWVESCYHLAKRLDPTRIIEDNSACNNDHVVTDLNSWHAYLPGYKWKSFLDTVVNKTFPGSTWNYIGGRKQGSQPMINSECGNVWGYDGSTGDIDWSWDYHIMMNELRSHPKCAGWLYTEHHDVINEWNGYYKFDRTDKYTGLGDIVPGMTINDLHSQIYIATGGELCRDVKKGDKVEVPLFLSCMTDQIPQDGLILKSRICEWTSLGKYREYDLQTRKVQAEPFANKAIESLKFEVTANDALLVLALTIESSTGTIYQHNFTTFRVNPDKAVATEVVTENDKTLNIITFAPNSFSDAKWSKKQWNILNGLKVNGAGFGYFEYHVIIPAGVQTGNAKGATLIFEASAKTLHGKDVEGSKNSGGDYMRGKGNLDPGLNPNSYPMTDSYKTPGKVKVWINGVAAGDLYLEDEPADSRGILSWHAQPKNNKLNEAGSYGYLCRVNIPADILKKTVNQTLIIRFEVDESFPGGLAIYGKQFGRYPLDPTVIIE